MCPCITFTIKLGAMSIVYLRFTDQPTCHHLTCFTGPAFKRIFDALLKFVLKNLCRLNKYTVARTEDNALFISTTKIFSNFVVFSENLNLIVFFFFVYMKRRRFCYLLKCLYLINQLSICMYSFGVLHSLNFPGESTLCTFNGFRRSLLTSLLGNSG